MQEFSFQTFEAYAAATVIYLLTNLVVVLLMRVLDWREGHFEFSSCAIDDSDEVGLATTHILLEHARYRDESAPRRLS